ncbi:diaminopimelate decarboxylase, partial [Candidatus Nomurabacteria bacterium]|nr:diaminopimelate decarboxylase [Candidatus Nomurabacteria bacterium]
MKKIVLDKIIQKFGTPIYLYEGNIIEKACAELKKNLRGVNLYYACKANTNLEIIKLIYKQGFGIETVSPGEIAITRKAGVPISKITFTCGSINEEELLSVVKQGIRVHLDSLHQVEMFGKKFPGKEISVRLNLNFGAGSHSHVITGGPNSKFGIDIKKIKDLNELVKKYNLKITGLHQHIGSNVLDANTFLKGVKALLENALLFPDLKHLDFGGGFGVPYKPSDKSLDMAKVGKEFKKMTSIFFKKYGRKLEVSFEPGRYLIAEAGSLITQVNDLKINSVKTFVGVNSGLNHFIRPAMYDAYHEIINLSNPRGKGEKVTIAGNMCESGDVFAKD